VPVCRLLCAPWRAFPRDPPGAPDNPNQKGFLAWHAASSTTGVNQSIWALTAVRGKQERDEEGEGTTARRRAAGAAADAPAPFASARSGTHYWYRTALAQTALLPACVLHLFVGRLYGQEDPLKMLWRPLRVLAATAATAVVAATLDSTPREQHLAAEVARLQIELARLSLQTATPSAGGWIAPKAEDLKASKPNILIVFGDGTILDHLPVYP
jgi:hypothetical protein